MADGLSVAASVAGLIQIADVVVRRGYRYVRDVENADESVKQLIDEVNKLSGVLHSLKNVAERYEEDEVDIEPTTQIHHIEACLKTLQLVDTHLEQADPSTKTDSMDNIQAKLRWPLKKSKVKKLLVEVEKHRSIMNLAMTASSMSALLLMLERQEDLRDNLLELKEGFEAERAQRAGTAIDTKRQKWLDFLSPSVDAQRWQRSNIALRQPGTGIWFTDGLEFRKWLSTDRSKLWVYGIPGAGKTVLMASAIQEALKHTDMSHALAFFYCDYKDNNTHSPTKILASLAKQIALQNEACFQILGDFYKARTRPGITGSTIEKAYCDLIGDLSGCFSSVMVIVDGLDEVSEDRSGVADLLQSLNKPSKNIKTLFASRREVDLERHLGGYKQLSIAAMSSDLRLYVASEIEKRTTNGRLRIRDPDLKDYIMKTLVKKADGMFRWVACQLDYLCECTNDRERREALTKLPPDLPSSYERILERINGSLNKGNQRLVARTLQWIVSSLGHMTIQDLLEALAIDEGDDDIHEDAKTTEEEILHWTSSLVRRGKFENLELAHFTVEEFLFSIDCVKKPQFAAYSMCRKDADIQISINCLTYLNSKTVSNLQWRNKAEVEKIAREYSFLSYVPACLDMHADEHMENTSISNLAHQLFHPATNRQFRLFRVISYWYWDKDLPEQLFNGETTSDDTTPLHWAAHLGLVELCAWLLEQGLSATQMSRAGTPMNCAVLGYGAMARHPEASRGLGFPEDSWKRPEDILKDSLRPLVVKLLLKNGASLDVPQIPTQTAG